jgi:hypothetical protein
MNLLYTPVLFGQGGADSARSFPASFSAAVLPATKPVRGDVKHFHQFMLSMICTQLLILKYL